MNDQEKIKELRKVLHKEIKGELDFYEKKEFLQESIDQRVLLRLHEKHLKRKKLVSVLIICYGIYTGILLLISMVVVKNLVMTILISFAIIFIPVVIWWIFDKSVLGYQKVDLVLRLITKFYTRTRHDTQGDMPDNDRNLNKCSAD
jgi:hypothetical protein